MNNDKYFKGSEKKEINLWDYWAVVRRRKWTIITFVLVLFATVTIRSYTVKPTYTAKGTLLIEKEPNILTFEEIFQIETFRDDYYQTQYKLLQSRALADRTLERLKLYGNPEGKSDPALRRGMVSAFLVKLGVSPVRQTRLVEISFKDHNPRFAAKAVNTLFDSFIDMNIEAKYEATEEATAFLTNQIASYRAEIEKKEKELQEYGASRNIIALSEKETTIVDKLGELNKALTEAQIDRVRKEAYYNEIKVASPDYIPATLTNPLITKLREDYVKLKREYKKKEEIFRPDYPEMQRLKTELDTAKNALESETKNLIKGAYSDYQAALKKEKSMEKVFNEQKEEANRLNSNAILYNSLKIEIENKKRLQESLLRRQSETGVAARLRGLRTSNVRIVDRAEVPLSPSSPNKKLNMILALITGLVGGLGLAFLFEYLDNSVKNSEDVEKYTGLPALGIIPTFSSDGFKKGYGYGYGHRRKTKGKKRKTKEKRQQTIDHRPQTKDRRQQTTDRDQSLKLGAGSSDLEESGSKKGKPQKIRSIELIPYISPQSNFSENYRSIRTSLLLSSADPNLKSIAITSSLPLEGKTATVSNLAITLAQADKKVLVVDSDLRKPRQHKIFKIKNLNGLTNYLTANIKMRDLIKETPVPNLFLINSGPVPPNPAELLGSEKMSSLIEALEHSFDYILFDTPPILATSDAMVLGSKIDGMILIVWGDKTSGEALKRAKEKLDLLKIKSLGVIINNIKIRRHDYYYKHYYYHYYGEAEDRL